MMDQSYNLTNFSWNQPTYFSSYLYPKSYAITDKFRARPRANLFKVIFCIIFIRSRIVSQLRA